MDLLKRAITTDPNKKTKIKTKLRDKDIIHAAKIIYGILNQRNQLDIFNAFNHWRHRNLFLREQYLKALLIKQIKTKSLVERQFTGVMLS